MPLPAAVRDVATETPFAESGDKLAPDDPSLTPPLVIADGWPAAFSANETPRRRVFNWLFNRLFAPAHYVVRYGILPWDAEVNYLAGATVQAGTQLWRATVATGPATTNATNPTTGGQTVWAARVASQTAPAAPAAPSGTTSNGKIVWQWIAPRDNGAAISGYIVQWRQSGAAWSDAARQANTSHPRYELAGLTNGTAYEFRVRATNSEGNSPWSAIGSATPMAEVPDKVSGLRLEPEAGSLEASWTEPEDNGGTITGYQIQWRSGIENWDSATRQAAPSGTSHTITGLTNGTAHSVRVRAVNSAGNGAWSEIVSGTPAIPTPDYFEFTAAGSRNTSLANQDGRDAALVLLSGPVIRQAGSDITTSYSSGIAVSGTNLYLIDGNLTSRIRAFVADTGTRNAAGDFVIGTPDSGFVGFAASGNTAYVLKAGATAIERWSLSGKTRVTGDATIAAAGRAIATDGTTMWVADATAANTAKAYVIANSLAGSASRDAGKDITLAGSVFADWRIEGMGIAENGTDLWLGIQSGTERRILFYDRSSTPKFTMDSSVETGIANPIQSIAAGRGKIWTSGVSNRIAVFRGSEPVRVAAGNQVLFAVEPNKSGYISGLTTASTIASSQGANSRIVIAPI